jgi:hypothetical protein
MLVSLNPGPATPPPAVQTPSTRAGQSVPEASAVADDGGVERYTLEQCLDKVVRGEIMDGKTLLGLFWYQFKFK